MTSSHRAHQRQLWALAALFCVTGCMHLISPQRFTPLMPRWLPAPRALIAVSGLAELAGAVGLLLPPVRRAAGWGLLALLVAVFPANIEMLRQSHSVGEPALWQLLLWLRLPLQPLLGWWIWRASKSEAQRVKREE